MTSMLLIERKGLRRPGASLFGAITRRDPLLLRVRRRRLLDLRTHDRLVRLDPVRDEVPLLSVPLLELHRSASLVVRAGHLDRLQETGGSELLPALVVDVQVLQAPAHPLSRQRFLAEF